jgi:hypothetical protein
MAMYRPHDWILRVLAAAVVLMWAALQTGTRPLLPAHPPVSPAVCDSSVICPGEELVYDVSWFGISLGRIRIKTQESITVGGKLQHSAVAVIDSYSRIPFVDFHSVHYTQLDERFYSLGFRYLEKKGDKWMCETSHYDFSGGRVVVEKAYQKEKTSPPIGLPAFDTLRIRDTLIEDGFSILYFARGNIRCREEITVPTIVYGKQGRTVFQFSNRVAYEDIEVLEHKKVRVIPLEGRAEFEGAFGLSGDFKGWFSDDRAAVPIKAEVKVLLGSITIELVRWKRDGWEPPTVPD